jgi:hypothetical protein
MQVLFLAHVVELALTKSLVLIYNQVWIAAVVVRHEAWIRVVARAGR